MTKVPIESSFSGSGHCRAVSSGENNLIVRGSAAPLQDAGRVAPMLASNAIARLSYWAHG